jgi:hypothetical protein
MLIGLHKTLSMLVVTLIKQGAIDREKTIKDFERFQESQGQEDHDETTRMWTRLLLEVLRNDPDRQPAAPVLKFPPKD